MPKLKTKSSAKKRFKVTGSGKIKHGVAYKRHGMRKRTPKANRQQRGTSIIAAADYGILAPMMPYKVK